MALAGLHIGHKGQKLVAVVAFRKALSLQNPFAFEDRVRIQKSSVVTSSTFAYSPARQKSLHDARKGRFAGRDRAGDADDIGDLAAFGAEEALGAL